MRYIKEIRKAQRDTDLLYADGKLSDYEYTETMWYLTSLEMHYMERIRE